MRLAVVINPAAGGARRLNRPARLMKQLRRAGHEITLYTTTKPGDGTLLAQQALAEGAEVVVAVGGDGTVNEVVQGMAGSKIPLAVYPAGTTNVWCKQVGMPFNPRRAAEVISNGPRRLIDLGRADEQYFLLMTGIGLDGEITHAIDLELKKKIGKLAYALAALRLGLHFQSSDVNIVLDPGSAHPRYLKLRSSMIIVTNAERYAVMKLAPEAQLDDGQLELLIFNEKNIWSRFRRAFSLITSRSEHDPHIERYQVHQALIEVGNSVGVQIDGDPQGHTGPLPLDIRCVPAALSVIVPWRAPAKLFTQARI